MELKDEINITCNRGFVYAVTMLHHPHLGMSFACYGEKIIARREYGRTLPPMGDNDAEWEAWEERFREWVGGPIADLELECRQYFNNKK